MLLVWYYLFYDMRTSVISGCMQVVEQHMMYYTVSRECVLKVCVEWFLGRRRRGEGRYMNHSSQAGNKVHFFIQTDHQSALARRYGWASRYQSAWRQPPSPQRGQGERGKCFDLNCSIYHTCFRHPKGQPRERERGEGREEEKQH